MLVDDPCALVLLRLPGAEHCALRVHEHGHATGVHHVEGLHHGGSPGLLGLRGGIVRALDGYIVKVARHRRSVGSACLMWHRHVVIANAGARWPGVKSDVPILTVPRIRESRRETGDTIVHPGRNRPSDHPGADNSWLPICCRPMAPGPVFLEAHEVYGELDHVNVDAMIAASSNSMGGQGHVRAERFSFGAMEFQESELHAATVGQAGFSCKLESGCVRRTRFPGSLFFDLTGKRPAFRTSAKFSGVDIAAVLQPFDNGRGKMTGQMEGDLTLAGQNPAHTPAARGYSQGKDM